MSKEKLPNPFDTETYRFLKKAIELFPGDTVNFPTGTVEVLLAGKYSVKGEVEPRELTEEQIEVYHPGVWMNPKEALPPFGYQVNILTNSGKESYVIGARRKCPYRTDWMLTENPIPNHWVVAWAGFKRFYKFYTEK